MTCPCCGRYCPPDPETGYDADEMCPDCAKPKEDCDLDEYWDRRYEESLDASDRDRD